MKVWKDMEWKWHIRIREDQRFSAGKEVSVALVARGVIEPGDLADLILLSDSEGWCEYVTTRAFKPRRPGSWEPVDGDHAIIMSEHREMTHGIPIGHVVRIDNPHYDPDYYNGSADHRPVVASILYWINGCRSVSYVAHSDLRRTNQPLSGLA